MLAYVYFGLGKSSDSVLATIIAPMSGFVSRVYGGNNWMSVPYTVSYTIFATTGTLAWAWKMSTRLNTVTALMIGLNTLVGPSKGSLLLPFLTLLVCRGFIERRMINRTVIMLGAAVAIGLPVLFVWHNDIDTNQMAETLVTYNHLFYYTARTCTELEPSADHLAQALSDLVIAPVPRALWANKPSEWGLTRRVLDHHMYSNYVGDIRSFTTMGLSEAWLALGVAGIVASGLCFGLLIHWCGRLMSDRRKPGNLIIGMLLVCSYYPLLRVGFLDFYCYYLLASVGIVKAFDQVAVRRRPRRVDSRAGVGARWRAALSGASGTA